MAPPFKEAEFDLIYGQGINRLGELIDLASQAGVVDKAGSWFSFNGERLGQGREQSMATLSEKPELLAQVENGVLEKYGIAARAIVSK